MRIFLLYKICTLLQPEFYFKLSFASSQGNSILIHVQALMKIKK